VTSAEGQQTGTMPAAVYIGEGKVVLQDIEIPSLRAGQVMVEVSYCGICGTDLHMVLEGWGRPGSVFGHEYSGKIVAVGRGVHDVSPGDLVVGGPGPGCGVCRWCDEERPNLCVERPGYSSAVTGAFARFKVVDADCTYVLPEGLDLRDAALAEPLAVALHAVERARVEPGDRALVTGAGPIGLLATAALIARGIADVTVTEPGLRRRKLAEQIGAKAVDPHDLDSPGLATDLVAEPFRAAIECSGRSEAMEQALAQLDRGGTLVLAGTGMRPPRLDPNRIIVQELTVTGTVDYTPDDYRNALGLLSVGSIPTNLLIEPDIQPLAAVQWAMEQLGQGGLVGKVLVSPNV
jgi:(R,R)-butanediol dehydrogenase/meso-butanediol dehydrogenase/diacetyl reductase